jgi:hypothetical protein
VIDDILPAIVTLSGMFVTIACDGGGCAHITHAIAASRTLEGLELKATPAGPGTAAPPKGARERINFLVASQININFYFH